MRGEEYDKEKLKKLRSRIIIKNYRIPNSEEVRELAQIYVQLSKFTAAKAIVREIYNEAMKKANSDKIMSEIIKQELSYNIMKYYRMGLSASQMAEELKLYTVDVIREINRQKELNVKIKEMHQEGKSEVDIADLLHENIERVKWGVESKQKDKLNYMEPNNRSRQSVHFIYGGSFCHLYRIGPLCPCRLPANKMAQ